MRRLYRDRILSLLEGYEGQSLPLDRFVNDYFRSHRQLGAGDRRTIGDAVFSLIRWRGLLDALSGSPFSWERRLDAWLSSDLPACCKDDSLPPHVRCSFPRWLFERLGEDLCLASNEEAPLTVRANALKTTRDALLEVWGTETRPTQQAQHGIVFARRRQLFGLPEYREGLFEVQDEASQLVAELVDAKPSQQILDYCAGSGGKSLAIAPAMANAGQLYLHDVRRAPLKAARKRLRRAGVQNVQIGRLPPRGSCDRVLVDAPCSGTGTLRRNVDAKWRLTSEEVVRLVALQREIFAKALLFKKPSGYIVYATCSLLPEENSEQVSYFCNQYNLKLQAEPFISRPTLDGMDGFFAALLA